jgi:ComF family protein
MQRSLRHQIHSATRIAARTGVQIASEVRSGAASLLLPSVCASCGHMLTLDGSGESKSVIVHCCDPCIEMLAKPYNACPCCASRDPGTSSDGGCFACRDRRFQFRWAAALGPYEGALREAVLRTKKRAEHCLTTALTELLWQRCGPRLADFKPDAVAAVPMHWWHRLRRGNNGPDIVCEVLARRLGVSSLPNLLARRRNTLPQSNLSQVRRRGNVRRAFRVRRSFALDRAKIVLVDDILTSAATAHEAAGMLRAAGAAEVVVAVLARADRPA